MTAADRITFNGDHPDEMVLNGVNVHLKRQNWHVWWGTLILPGAHAQLTFADLHIFDVDRLPIFYGGPDLLGCDTEWSSHGRLHRCRINPTQHADSLRHLCECGSWQRAKEIQP